MIRPASAEADADPYPRKWWIALAVTLVSVMELVDTSVINVAIPQMSANLGATIDEIIWVSIGYILAAVIMIPMAGYLASVFGRRNYYLGSVVLFTAASMCCGWSDSLEALIFWRVIQGIGGGAFLSTTQAILHDSFPPEEKRTAMALYGVGMMCGPAIGPTLGGYITQNYSWPWIFYVNLPFGILSFFLLSAFLKDRDARKPSPRADFLGLALMALGIGSLQFVLDRGEHYGWFDSWLITVLAATSALSLSAMVWWELRHDEPFLNLRVLRDPALRSGSIFVVILGLTVFGNVFMAPLFMQTLLGYDPETAGWIAFPGAIASAFGMLAGSKLMEKMESRTLLFLGAAAMIYSMFLHSRFTGRMDQSSLLWPTILRGFGAGIMFMPLNTRALMNLKGRDLTEGSAIFNLMRQLGGSLGIALLATMLTRGTTRHMAEITEKANLYEPETQERLARLVRGLIERGSDPALAPMRSLAVLEQLLRKQAALLSFQNVFALVGWIMIFSLPLILILRQSSPARPAGPGGAGPAGES
jgi:DHA2 family multidrug resistance protein